MEPQMFNFRHNNAELDPVLGQFIPVTITLQFISS